MRMRACSILAAALMFTVSQAPAQTYPNRPVRLIVPYPPGGATDIISRSIAAKLAASLGQQFMVDNRPGGGQKIGTALAAKAPADGYTMLLVSVTHSINPALDPKLPYDSIRDFVPVTLVASSPNAVVLHPSIPVRTVKEMIALARARPDGINLATSGLGSGGHLAGALFQSMTKTRMTAIHYKGGGPAYVDLMAGQVDAMFTSPNPTLSYARAGKLRAIAMTGARRSPSAPELPTVAEAAGLPGYEASLWYGIVTPAGVPKDIVTLLNTEIVKGMQAADVREPLAKLAVEVHATSAEAFAEHLRTETQKWARVIKEANIRIE